LVVVIPAPVTDKCVSRDAVPEARPHLSKRRTPRQLFVFAWFGHLQANPAAGFPAHHWEKIPDLCGKKPSDTPIPNP
jgi:hypothetical protein